MFKFLYKSQELISYDFIFYFYLISVIIFIVLFLLEYYASIESVKGFYFFRVYYGRI